MHDFLMIRIATLMVALLGWFVTIVGGTRLMQHAWGEALGSFALAGLVFAVAMWMDRTGDRLRDVLLDEECP